jgi:hypothetical protein
MYTRNLQIEDMIERLGVTAGCPLFNQEKENTINNPDVVIQHPDWLWSGNSMKAEIYNRLKTKFADDAFEYLNALIALGGRATDHQIKEYFNDNEKWTLAIVSARRNYFTKAPYYLIQSFPGQKSMGPKGVANIIWFINYKNLFNLTV